VFLPFLIFVAKVHVELKEKQNIFIVMNTLGFCGLQQIIYSCVFLDYMDVWRTKNYILKMHPNMKDIFGNGVYFGNLLELLQAVSNSLFIKSKEHYQDYLTTFTKLMPY